MVEHGWELVIANSYLQRTKASDENGPASRVNYFEVLVFEA